DGVDVLRVHHVVDAERVGDAEGLEVAGGDQVGDDGPGGVRGGVGVLRAGVGAAGDAARRLHRDAGGEGEDVGDHGDDALEGAGVLGRVDEAGVDEVRVVDVFGVLVGVVRREHPALAPLPADLDVAADGEGRERAVAVGDEPAGNRAGVDEAGDVAGVGGDE